MRPLRIATRRSPLALWQAEYVAKELTLNYPGLSVDLVEITTTGDRLLGAPLASAGGKGLFMKELEVSMREDRADIAVHSMKDVVVSLPQGFEISAVCERDDPLDAFVSNQYESLQTLPAGASVGTCSMRRQCQIRNAFPELRVIDLRGSVNTRLGKLDSGEFDAIILAAAGLKRLGIAGRIRQRLSTTVSLPAVGQGAVGIECRQEDGDTVEMVKTLEHTPTRICVDAERSMNRTLEGGCQVPVGAFAQLHNGQLELEGLVGTVDGKTILRARAGGPGGQAGPVGRKVADDLITQGAKEILREVYRSNPSE